MAEPPKLQKKTFQKPAAAIASYNSVELLTNQGYLTLYLMDDGTSGGSNWILSTETPASYDIYTERSGAGTTTRTFDSGELTKPLLVSGTAYFNCAVFWGAATSGYVTAQLYTWNGASATAITAKATSATVGGGATDNKNILLEMPITSAGKIAAGLQIRLVMECVYVGGGAAFRWSHDPAGRTTGFSGATSVDTASTINVPVKVFI